MPMIPETLGRYKIISLIGRGGMAEVYAGVDTVMGREVAIKIMPRELLHDATFRSRFELEASTLASLEHHAIVPVYDFGETDGRPYLVMRLLKGRTLAQRMKDGPLSLQEACRILKTVALGLDEAHKRGIIHRDLKPGNILFDDAGEAYITDFGLVKLTEATASLTGNVIVGTPAYMSPEQGRGEKDLDGRSDVYSLGVILFEMLTGQLPFEADADMAFIIKHISAPIPNLQDFRSGLPNGCQELINRSMSKRREGRFITAGEMAQAMQAVSEGRPIPALQPSGAIPRARTKAPDESGSYEKVEGQEERKKPNLALRIGLGLLLLALVLGAGAGGFTYMQGMWNMPTLQAWVYAQTPTATLAPPSATPTARPAPTRTPVPTRTPTLEPTAELAPAETPTLPAPTAPPLPGLFPIADFAVLPQPAGMLGLDTIQGASKVLTLGQGIFYDLAFTRDGSRVAVGATTGVYLFSPDTLEQQAWLPAQSPVRKISFSPDGRWLAAAEQDSAVIWDWQAQERVLTLFPPETSAGTRYVDTVAFSPDSQVLIGGSSSAYVWDASSGELILEFPNTPASYVSVSVDHQYAAIPLESSIQLVRLADGAVEQELKFYDATQTAFLPGGSLLVAAGRDIVNLFQLNGEVFGRIGGRNLKVSGDGSSLLVDNGEGLVQVWRLNEFAMPQFPLRFYTYNNLENRIDFQISNNGSVVAYWTTADIIYRREFSPNFIQVQDVIEGTSLGGDNMTRARLSLESAQLPPMFLAAISPADGKTMITLRDYSLLESWDVTTTGVQHQLYYRAQPADKLPFDAQVYRFATKDVRIASQDNVLTAYVEGTDVQINLSDGSQLRTIQANLVSDPDIAFAPNAELLATLSSGGTVRLWRIATGQQVCVAGLISPIRDAGKIFFSDDSSLLVIHHTNDDISYWDASSCSLVVRYPLAAEQVSPDGSLFVEITPDRINVRRVENGSIQRVLYGRYRLPVGFDAGGAYLAATEMDYTVHAWAILP